MTITFWGAWGSLPVPGPHTLRYGGNTGCVSVEIDGKVLVLDAGTGIFELVLRHGESDGFSPVCRALLGVALACHSGAMTHSGAWMSARHPRRSTRQSSCDAALGQALLGAEKDVFALLSHLHSDHTQGLPFFAPLYKPAGPIYLLDYEQDGEAWSPLTLFNGVRPPLRKNMLPPECREARA